MVEAYINFFQDICLKLAYTQKQKHFSKLIIHFDFKNICNKYMRYTAVIYHLNLITFSKQKPKKTL